MNKQTKQSGMLCGMAVIRISQGKAIVHLKLGVLYDYHTQCPGSNPAKNNNKILGYILEIQFKELRFKIAALEFHGWKHSMEGLTIGDLVPGILRGTKAGLTFYILFTGLLESYSHISF